MFYLPFGIRIIFGPKGHKLAQMMRSEDGPIPGEIIKIVHDDSNEKVENQEGTNDKEGDEVDVGKVGSTKSYGSSLFCLYTIIRILIANDIR